MGKKTIIAISVVIGLLSIVILVLSRALFLQRVYISKMLDERNATTMFPNWYCHTNIPTDFIWAKRGMCKILANRHLLIWDNNGNVLVQPDFVAKREKAGTIAALDDGHGKIGAMKTIWFQNDTLFETLIYPKYFNLCYVFGDKSFMYIDQNGEWNAKSIGSNNWFRVGNVWYLQKGENKQGAIIEVNNHDYIVKYGSTGSVLHAIEP